MCTHCMAAIISIQSAEEVVRLQQQCEVNFTGWVAVSENQLCLHKKTDPIILQHSGPQQQLLLKIPPQDQVHHCEVAEDTRCRNY